MANQRDVRPMSRDEIMRAQQRFIELTGEALSECTCVRCHRMERNCCAYQFDAYNTNNDCLLSK